MKNQNFRDELKKIVSKDINEFFEEYANRILANSKESNLVISIEGRFRELKNQEIKGIISNEEYNRELNKIRASLLDLIDQIESSNYIPNLDSNEIEKIILQLNNNSLKTDELLKEQGKQIESLNHRISYMQQEFDKLRLKILERSILSIDTQDANMESYFMSEYIQICQKYNNSIVNYEVDKIIDAVVKYSKKYPDLMASEKLMLIEGLNKLNLNVVNKKKLENIMENFELK
jgi:hypothetical protein